VLSTGWVEQDSIRCYYHGWRFDAAGQCLEQPAERKPFCDRVRIRSYPVQEHLGLIFAYLGDGEAPPFPTWPEFEAESVSSIVVLPCNYFQSAENIMDDVHVAFTHRGTAALSGGNRGFEPPTVSAEETSFGMIARFASSAATENNLWIMPNTCCLAYDLVVPESSERMMTFRNRTLFWYVPIDDENHYHAMVTVPGSPIIRMAMERENRTPHSVSEQIFKILSGQSRAHHGISSPSDPKISDLIRTQDGVAIVGQGAIVDRDSEHLGASDVGVALLRSIWKRELRRLDADEPLTVFTRPAELDTWLARG
jgi:5,5'-dehydrodivanillate O-demethylase